MHLEQQQTPQQRMTTRAKAMTRMAPNVGLGLHAESNTASECSSISAASGAENMESKVTSAMQETMARVRPIPCPNEPNLFQLPVGISPTYRPLPIAVQLTVWFLSATIAALTTWRRRLAWLTPIVAIQAGHWKWRKLVQFAVKTALIGVGSNMVLQDMFLPPSRLSMQSLLQTYFLPSALSRYEPVMLANTTGTSDSLGVHWLQYEQPPKFANAQYAFQALYVNHGFGASSLSWLPALPVLVHRTNARTGLGHDAVGFGFTERPPVKNNSLAAYTSMYSATIGVTLLQQQVMAFNASSPVLLLGHSLGAIATLRMALQLDANTSKRIILVAPALGISRTGGALSTKPSEQQQSLFRVPAAVWQVPAAYALRRLVGIQNFWRKGLQLVWGDPARLKDSDVLRFEWPAVLKGWERALLRFSSAQSLASDMSDVDLMQSVLDLPNTTVDVIVGSKDRIVSPTQARKFLEPFPQVRVVELAGLGHDPFEEDVDTFVQTVEDLLRKGSSSKNC